LICIQLQESSTGKRTPAWNWVRAPFGVVAGRPRTQSSVPVAGSQVAPSPGAALAAAARSREQSAAVIDEIRRAADPGFAAS
jgi:hypothetical protein